MKVFKLYEDRFSAKELSRKNRIWKLLCGCFFQKYVGEDSTALDLGCGNGEFINNIRCKVKYAVDMNETNAKFAAPGVSFVKSRCSDLSFLKDNSVGLVFISNLLEHLGTREEIVNTLCEVQRVLKAGGKALILGPNIRYAYKNYWDFFDHIIPLSDKSLGEALSISGFVVEKLVPRFLPYTTKNRLSCYPLWLMRLYLRLPLLWMIFGKQMFVVARKGS